MIMAHAGSFMITAFYRGSNNDIQPYSAYYPFLEIGDSVYTNVSVSTRENIGLEKNTGISLFGNLKATNKFNLRRNLFFFRRHIINGIDSGSNSTSFNYRLNLNASYQFNKDLSAEFFGNFNSARNELQGKYPSFTSYTFAARKQFWNKKRATWFLTASNPFNQYFIQLHCIWTKFYNQHTLMQVPFRSFGINLHISLVSLSLKKIKKTIIRNRTPATATPELNY